MADVINLRRTRKAKAKTDAERTAAQNRQIFGQPRSMRERLEAERRNATSHLDGHQLKPEFEE